MGKQGNDLHEKPGLADIPRQKPIAEDIPRQNLNAATLPRQKAGATRHSPAAFSGAIDKNKILKRFQGTISACKFYD